MSRMSVHGGWQGRKAAAFLLKSRRTRAGSVCARSLPRQAFPGSSRAVIPLGTPTFVPFPHPNGRGQLCPRALGLAVWDRLNWPTCKGESLSTITAEETHPHRGHRDGRPDGSLAALNHPRNDWGGICLALGSYKVGTKMTIQICFLLYNVSRQCLMEKLRTRTSCIYS
jgi:hypothetical protein